MMICIVFLAAALGITIYVGNLLLSAGIDVFQIKVNVKVIFI